MIRIALTLVCSLAWAACCFGGRPSGPAASHPPPLPATRNAHFRGGLGACWLHPANSTCITPSQRQRIERRIVENRTRLGINPGRLAAGGGVAGETLLYRYYPQGGTFDHDLLPPGFVDHDASFGFQDYSCHPFTYDGHAGTDTGLRSFAEQLIGMPVFAALDGVVIDSNDGEPDMNLNGGDAGNYVILDNGSGRETWYFHLKKDSVAVAIGENVAAGQQLGLAASSGNSFGPHLHFESRQAGQVFDPFAGACNLADSGFETQPPLTLTPYLADFGATVEDLFMGDPLPFEQPRTGQFGFDDVFIYLWFQAANLPADAAWRFVFLRPDGTTALDESGTLGNVSFLRYWPGFFYWYVEDMHTIAGTWHVDVYFDNQLMVHAPIEVVAVKDPNFNRAPEPIAAHFEPAAPAPDDVIFCRIETSLTVDDKDYDTLRYHYLWTLDGNAVRDVITAAHSDAIPRSTAQPGQTIACAVTPNDGKVDGPSAAVSWTMPVNCPADLNGDNAVNGADLGLLLSDWNAAKSAADLNDDGMVNGADLGLLLSAWGGCA